MKLNLREFLEQAFRGGEQYLVPIWCDYNPLLPFSGPAAGEMVNLAGVQIYVPGLPKPPSMGRTILCVT